MTIIPRIRGTVLPLDDESHSLRVEEAFQDLPADQE